MLDVQQVLATVDGVQIVLELEVRRTGATSLVLRSGAPGVDEPEWELQSAYLGALGSRTHSLHVLSWRGGSTSTTVEHRDGHEPEACLPLFRPGACVEDHLARLLDLATAQFGAKLAVEVTDELLGRLDAALWA